MTLLSNPNRDLIYGIYKEKTYYCPKLIINYNNKKKTSSTIN